MMNPKRDKIHSLKSYASDQAIQNIRYNIKELECEVTCIFSIPLQIMAISSLKSMFTHIHDY